VASKNLIKGEHLYPAEIAAGGVCRACGSIRVFRGRREGYVYLCGSTIRRKRGAPARCKEIATCTRSLLKVLG